MPRINESLKYRRESEFCQSTQSSETWAFFYEIRRALVTRGSLVRSDSMKSLEPGWAEGPEKLIQASPEAGPIFLITTDREDEMASAISFQDRGHDTTMERRIMTFSRFLGPREAVPALASRAGNSPASLPTLS